MSACVAEATILDVYHVPTTKNIIPFGNTMWPVAGDTLVYRKWSRMDGERGVPREVSLIAGCTRIKWTAGATGCRHGGNKEYHTLAVLSYCHYFRDNAEDNSSTAVVVMTDGQTTEQAGKPTSPSWTITVEGNAAIMTIADVRSVKWHWGQNVVAAEPCWSYLRNQWKSCQKTGSAITNKSHLKRWWVVAWRQQWDSSINRRRVYYFFPDVAKRLRLRSHPRPRVRTP